MNVWLWAPERVLRASIDRYPENSDVVDISVDASPYRQISMRRIQSYVTSSKKDHSTRTSSRVPRNRIIRAHRSLIPVSC